MNLSEQINADIKNAMLQKDADKLKALRAIKSELLLLKTEKGGAKDDDSAELKMLQKLVKQRKESARIYKEQNREDLYETEMLEVGYIEAYLPKQLSEEDLEKIISEIIKTTGADSMKDMGKVMGVATGKLAGQADGKAISALVRKLLA